MGWFVYYGPKAHSEKYLMHFGRSIKDGAPVGSGRYRAGSGKNPRAFTNDRAVNKELKKTYKTAKQTMRPSELAVDLENNRLNIKAMNEVIDDYSYLVENMEMLDDSELDSVMKTLSKSYDEFSEAVEGAKEMGDVKSYKKMIQNVDNLESIITSFNSESADRAEIKKITKPLVSKVHEQIRLRDKYWKQYEKTKSQSDYDKYVTAEQNAADYLDEISNYVLDVDEFVFGKKGNGRF
ncbi:MAG: hypothetical protein ILN61_06180 [Lachnospiraceae bacterium]|nr:hypothetical protein [Lachnospiraceae bacterium]